MENSVKNASKRPLRPILLAQSVCYVRFLRVICVFQGTFTVVLVRLPLQRCVYFCILRLISPIPVPESRDIGKGTAVRRQYGRSRPASEWPTDSCAVG